MQIRMPFVQQQKNSFLCKFLGKITSPSVVDPNTLNLDPDPGFWPNLDPDPDPGLNYQF